MELIRLENVAAVLEEYAVAVRNKYQDNLILHDRIAKGDLLNKVEYRVVQDGQVWEVQLTLQDYWKYVEYGTKPHFPPVDKILEWVMVKPVIPRPDADGNIPTPQQLAYLIARKISKVGTEGSEDLQDAIATINEQFKDKLVIALSKDMEVLMKVIVGEIQGSLSR